MFRVRGPALIYLPSWLFFLQSFLLFSSKIRGVGDGGRAITKDPPLKETPFRLGIDETTSRKQPRFFYMSEEIKTVVIFPTLYFSDSIRMYGCSRICSIYCIFSNWIKNV